MLNIRALDKHHHRLIPLARNPGETHFSGSLNHVRRQGFVTNEFFSGTAGVLASLYKESMLVSKLPFDEPFFHEENHA